MGYKYSVLCKGRLLVVGIYSVLCVITSCKGRLVVVVSKGHLPVMNISRETGDVTFANKICIGNTCIDETDLQVLIGERNMNLRMTSGSHFNKNQPWVHLNDGGHLIDWKENPIDLRIKKEKEKEKK